MDLLARVRDLVALARSSAEEEARTAAVQACRLILEHKLEVLDRDELERLRALERAGPATAEAALPEALKQAGARIQYLWSAGQAISAELHRVRSVLAGSELSFAEMAREIERLHGVVHELRAEAFVREEALTREKAARAREGEARANRAARREAREAREARRASGAGAASTATSSRSSTILRDTLAEATGEAAGKVMSTAVRTFFGSR